MSALPLADIQGIILHSYRMNALRLYVLEVTNAEAARSVLGVLPVTSGAPWDDKPKSCLNVAITGDGLAALQLPADALKTFPQEFIAGALSRAAIVGDTGANAPENWKPVFRGSKVHVLLLLFAQTKEILETQASFLRELWSIQGAFSEAYVHDGAMLPGEIAHFGYKDGFSQPTIDGGLPNPVPESVPATPAGAFVLGHPSQSVGLYPVPQPQKLGNNGSFLALRILEQNCVAFEQLMKEAPQKYGMDSELLAAKMCGRWRNGIPLALSPDSPTPAQPVSLENLNSFDYTDDPKGFVCPAGSHMRRFNPRSSPVIGGGGLKHRIVRRGLPYGPLFDPANPNDGNERGLLGLFIGSSLKDHFEFVMHDWINGGIFAAGLVGTVDPVLGNTGNGQGKFLIPVPPKDNVKQKPIEVSFPQLVTTRGSSYAFLPSLSALQYIADL